MRRPAGEYIHPITVNKYTESPNGAGQLTPTATVVCSRFARKLIPNGREITLPEGYQQAGLNYVIFAVPYDSVTSTIDPKMMITYQGEQYEITFAADAQGRREEIQINAIQRAT